MYRYRVYKLRGVKGQPWRVQVFDMFGSPLPMTFRNRFWYWDGALAQAVAWSESGRPPGAPKEFLVREQPYRGLISYEEWLEKQLYG